MAVRFVYRSHYDNPGAFHVRRFDADSVLDWFRGIWQGIPNVEPDWQASDHAEKLIGRSVYSFGSLFSDIHEHGWPPPKTMRMLIHFLQNALYVNELRWGSHHVQILTDDDELEMAIYIFDDHYAMKHPDRCAFLMRDDWVLPDGGAVGKFRQRGARVGQPLVAGEGCIYIAHFAAYDGANLSDLNSSVVCDVIPNVRVPDLPRFLIALRQRPADQVNLDAVQAYLNNEVMSGLAPAVKAAKGQEAAFLKAVAANPDDLVCWGAYSDWLLENDRPPLLERILKKYQPHSGSIRDTRNPKKDHVVAHSHVAQASKHVARWENRWGHDDLYHHFVFFDDLWANAHPHLAASLLRTANRWDPL